MLRAIQRLTMIPKNQEGRVNRVVFTFIKNKGSKSFEGKVQFYTEERLAPIASELALETSIVFEPPEGHNADEIFEWLFVEVGKLAYAMTGGEVRREPRNNRLHNVEKWVDDFAVRFTYIMTFFHFGPDIPK